MDIVDLVLLSAGAGTLISLFLLVDGWRDIRAAGIDPKLRPLARGRFAAEGFRFLGQASFLTAALIAEFREPATFRMTIRYLLVAVPILLAVSSLVSWWAKRRLLAGIE